MYALIATGYTMVYGVLRMINFAHGEVFMSGPYTAYFVAAWFYRSDFLDTQPILSLVVIFLVAMSVSGTDRLHLWSGWPTGPCGAPRGWCR